MGSGFCAKRLGNMDAFLQRIIEKGQVAGAGVYIVRHGEEAYYKSFGMQDREKGITMKNDSIYRLFSMTKTFTIVTAMTLYEKGLFKLHDPIAEFLPAFSNVQVAQHDSRGNMQLVPAKGPITFEHLFTMTSGIPYPGPDSYSSRRFAEFQSAAVADPSTDVSTAQVVDMVAGIPLCFQPGEYWMYGFSHDVLGRLIEVISGKSFGDYMAEVILEPLGLSDTRFFVSEEKRSRLAQAYDITATGPVEKTDLNPVPFTKPAFESGGAGLMSTLRDVGAYASMLLNSGKSDTVRILSRKTVDLIRQNHLLDSQKLAQFGFPAMSGYGYGLGVRTMQNTSRAGLNGSVGEWAWDGMLGTWYCVDPAEDLIAVFLVQRYPGANEDLAKRFAQVVYGAIDE
ncbi:serine hydrolase [Spirochaetia bacterium]|nr:serine hydrolase [Spirochaetia bacterium]GHU33945.1 serine hydrolase [Spirochaetia bacterium]